MDQFNFKSKTQPSLIKFVACSFLLTLLTLPYSTRADNYSETVMQGQYPEYPKIDYGTGAKADQLKRGEYLTTMGDCIACHTKPGDKPFAGGYAVNTPFGKIFTPNITSDKETGIGNWTDQQFIRAMREGISPQNTYYYPAFPYSYFNKLTTEDLLAIRAYLNAIPAVYKVNQKNQMDWPFSWRFLQLGWRSLFFNFQKSGPYQTNPHESAEWNRGAYIVLGLGHCDMCHTQMHYFVSKKWILGAPVWKYHLTGGMVEGFYAPNITGTLLKGVPVQELEDVFKKDEMIGGGEVQGPMKEANHDSLKYLTTDDVKAIDTYLVSVKSEVPPKPSTGSGINAGKGTFDQYCAGCHLTGAGGAPKIGDVTAWDALSKLGLNTLYKNAINGIGGMPAKGTCSTCSIEDIQNAVQYMVAQSKPGIGQALGQTNVPPPKPLTLEDGKKVYEQYCQACHNGAYQGAPVLGNKQEWGPLIDNGVQTLIIHSITGYNNMPARGSCAKCNDAQIKAAVIYMIEQGKTKGDYKLWLGM